MTLQLPSSHSPTSTSCPSCSPLKSYIDMENSLNTAVGNATRCPNRSNKLRGSISFEISGGSLPWPSLPNIHPDSRLRWRYVFSLYRFATLALILGLSIALIPISIIQRKHDGSWQRGYGWHSHHRGQYNYICGLSVTSLLFTFVA
jgi:hypothetical protein